MSLKRFIISFLVFILGMVILTGQTIRGIVADRQDNPIPYATIYIVELTEGTTANVDGKFDIKVPEGNYTIYIRALGYRTEVREVTVGKKPFTLNVRLLQHIYQIQEVRIYSG